MNPLVSICIPVYNGERYLKEAVQSALDQSYDHLEIVIVDDGSSDDSYQIAQSFSDDRIKLYKNEGPHGIGHNWNKCIESSRGEYFCLLHQDDCLHSDYVKLMLEGLNTHAATAIHCPAFIIDEHSRVRFSFFDTIKYFISKKTPELTLKTITPLFKYDLIMCPTVFYDRNKMESIGPFDTKWKTALDYEMWFRILLKGGRICFNAKKLYSYRRHDEMCSQGMKKDLRKYEEDYALKILVREEAHQRGISLSLCLLKRNMALLLFKDFIIDLIRLRVLNGFWKIRYLVCMIFKK